MAPRGLKRLFDRWRRQIDKSTKKEKENLYTYEEIQSPEHIRLLRLEPGHGKAPLCCSFTQVSLDNIQPYEAISYAWGDPKDCVSIACDGQNIKITRNLFEALQVFRQPNEPRYLWADAICIDQNNLEERGAQVQRMARIYLEATKVLMWLGREKAKTVNTAFEFLRRSVTGSSPPQHINKPTRDALKCMFSCNVFQRGWVIQEFALAPSVDVCWDHELMNVRDFSRAIDHNSDNLFDLVGQISGLGNCAALFEMFNIRRIQQDGKTYKPLELVRTTQDFYFSDGRDRIYGILALPIAFDKTIHGNTYIKPDYTMGILATFRTFTEACLIRDNCLDTLLFVNNVDNTSENWPSWLPNWSKLQRSWLALMHTGYSCGLEHMDMTKPIGSGTDHITLRGITVASVDEILGGQDFGDPDEQAQTLLHTIWDQFDHTCVVHTALSLKFITDPLDMHAQPGDSDYSEVRKTACAEFLELELDQNDLPTFTPGRITRSEFGGQFGWMYKVSTIGSLFFRTSQGMLGLGTRNIQKGDTVVVLFAGTGANLSFILRPSGSFWKLLGPCYIYDLKDGSAVRKWKESGKPAETFDIC